MFKRNLGLVGFLILLMALASACATGIALPQSSTPTATAQPNLPSASATGKSKDQRGQPTPVLSNNSNFFATEILGRPTNTSVIVNVVPAKNMEIYYEYGTASGNYTNQTATVMATANIPIESVIDKLAPNARYYYRLRYRQPGSGQFAAGAEHTFVTKRAPGSTFTFDIQGDTHPERRGKQFDPDLYTRTLQRVASDQPDFFMTIGDDFSVDTLKTINADTVAERYTLQRPFLGLVGSSAPIFLVKAITSKPRNTI